MDYAFRLVWSCLLNEQCVNIHDTSIIIFTLEPISSHSSSDRISDQISDSSNQSKVRLNVTSTTDLFTYAKKQSSLHSKLSRIDHPMSPSNRSQGSLVATIDHDSKMQISIPMKNIPTRPKSRDLQPFIDGLNHTIRSKYEDLWVERIKIRILFVFFVQSQHLATILSTPLKFPHLTHRHENHSFLVNNDTKRNVRYNPIWWHRSMVESTWCSRSNACNIYSH